MIRKCIAILGVCVGTLVASPRAEAAPVQLSNDPITQAFICGLFDCTSPVAVLFNQPFTLSPAPDPDGFLTSLVLAGNQASSAGQYLYAYQLLAFATAPEQVHGLRVPFPAIVPPVPPNGASFSFRCVDCSDPAFLSPSPAQFDPDLVEASWFFLDQNSMDPGDQSLVFGAVSTLAPVATLVNILGTTQGGQALALAPAAVPEPVSMLLMGSGLAGAMARRRRKVRV